MALTSRINASISAAESFSDDLGTPAVTHALSLAASIASGTGTSQNDRVFSDTRTLAASANEDIDLSGALAGKLVGNGATVVFAEVLAIMIKADAANTNNVLVTRPASNGVPFLTAAGDGFAIPPGGAALFYWPGATGIAVTAATGDLINIANSAAGTGVTYQIVILGRSA